MKHKNKTATLMLVLFAVLATSCNNANNSQRITVSLSTLEQSNVLKLVANESDEARINHNLEIEIKTNPNYEVKTQNKHTTATIRQFIGMTDISGDGLKFYKPTWTASQNVASMISDVSNSYVVYIISFSIKNNGDQTTSVRPAEKTTIVPYNPEKSSDVYATKSLRSAIISYNNIVSYWNPYAESDTDLYVKKAPQDVSAYGVSGFEICEASTIPNYFNGAAYLNEDQLDYYEPSPASPQIFILEPGETKSGEIRLWLEGTDTQCFNEAINGSFIANYEFLGVYLPS